MEVLREGAASVLLGDLLCRAESPERIGVAVRSRTFLFYV